MDRFFSFLVKHKAAVIIIFALICVPAVLGMGLMKTSFEMSTFLPENAGSIKGAVIEEDELSTGARAYMLLEDSENWRLRELKEAIGKVEGVGKAQWLGDVLDIYTPEKFLSKQALEQFKKGNSTIIIITFEDLSGGIGELNDDGLKELKSKFDGLEGYLDKLSAMAESYGSFMDGRNADISTVQFVMKTKGIGTEE